MTGRRSHRRIGTVRGLMGGCRPLVRGRQTHQGTGETGTCLLPLMVRALHETRSHSSVMRRG